jgi:hypothetical protein
MEYVRDRRDGSLEELKFEAARVVRVDAVGMGDRCAASARLCVSAYDNRKTPFNLIKPT